MAKTEIHPDPVLVLTPRQCCHGAIGNLIVREVADAVIAGNVGCLVQIAAHLERAGHGCPVLHTVQLVDRAISP
jgi:Fe-S oxidoreductase